jgi:hypothetical protein
MSRAEGRPSTDAEFQNLKSASTITTRKLTAQEVASSAVIAGEVVADVGAFNTLNVENLTVTNSNALNEILSGSHVILPLALGTLSATGATYTSTTAPQVALVTPAGSEISWTVYVPNSGTQRQVRVATVAALPAGELEVVVNGTTLAIGATPITNTTQAYDTSAFNWTVGGPMTVVVKWLSGTPILSDSVIVW